MGLFWIRRRVDLRGAAREATDVIGAIKINANDSIFDARLAA